MRIRDWSSYVCASDLALSEDRSSVSGLSSFIERAVSDARRAHDGGSSDPLVSAAPDRGLVKGADGFLRRPYRDYDEYLEHQRRSEEHTSELQSLMRISYAVFCLKTKTLPTNVTRTMVTTIKVIQTSRT